MIKACFFGRISYKYGLTVQEQIYELTKNLDNLNCLCFFEHNPVYTVGIRDHLYPSQEEQRLIKLGAEFYRTDRGGLITYHGPGQLIAYPIFNLRALSENSKGKISYSVRQFVNLMEEVIIKLLSENFSLQHVGRTHDPGVWVENNRKIAAIGIKVRNGITSHGIALNCDTDLKWFDHIIACGLKGKKATSISNELQKNVPISDVILPLCSCFQSVFHTHVEYSDLSQLIPDPFELRRILLANNKSVSSISS